MKSQLLFRLEKQPAGFNAILAPDCKVEIPHKSGQLNLNYGQSIVGHYDNLRIDGEAIIADIYLDQSLDDGTKNRFEYSISGDVLKTNDKGEANLIRVRSAVAIMSNKF